MQTSQMVDPHAWFHEMLHVDHNIRVKIIDEVRVISIYIYTRTKDLVEVRI